MLVGWVVKVGCRVHRVGGKGECQECRVGGKGGCQEHTVGGKKRVLEA